MNKQDKETEELLKRNTTDPIDHSVSKPIIVWLAVFITLMVFGFVFHWNWFIMFIIGGGIGFTSFYAMVELGWIK